MYTLTDFKEFLFIDIETAAQYRDLSEVPENLSKLWESKAEFQRKNEDGMQDLSDEQIYEKCASWFPEFGKIICISIGQVKFDEAGVPQTSNIRSFYGDNEKELLHEFNGTMQAVFNKNSSVKLVGHNIKRFDMPWIVKRSLINGLKVPHQFHFQKQKPWENCLVDTYEIWKFGGMNSTSLDLICAVFDIPSPKQDMSNDQVSERYYEGQLEKIKTYCEGDVEATMNVMLKVSDMPILETPPF